MPFRVLSVSFNTWLAQINFRQRMNEHKSGFRIYRLGTGNKLDSKILYDLLNSYNSDLFKDQIVITAKGPRKTAF